MITVTAVGRIGRDAELRHTQNGKAIRTFSIAVDRGWGENKKSDWYKVVEFGKRAENGLIQYLVKGAEVAVTGEQQMDEWTDKQGNKRLNPTIVVRDIKLVGGKKEAKPQAAPQSGDTFQDDIPF